MGKLLVAVAVLVGVAVIVFWLWRRRRMSGVEGAGLIWVTPQEFALNSREVKAAAERVATGEPQFHPVEVREDEEGNVVLQMGEHPVHIGRTEAPDDEDRYGMAFFYLAGSSSLEPNEAYQLLGKLAAELMPAGTTRLIAPHLGREEQITPELRANMAKGDFMVAASFYGEPWAVQVDGDSAEMRAAVEEARTRWPEFVTAFENRAADPEANFAVKMPIVFAEENEFIWIEVQEVTPEEVRGVLANDSMYDRSVKAGHAVTAPVKDLNDWIITRGDDMTGGFTIPVLMRKR